MALFYRAQLRRLMLGTGLGLIAVALSGCGSIDDALFGDQAAAPSPAAQTAQATPAPAPEAPVSAPPSDQAAPETTPTPAPAPPPADLGITLASIEPATSTGTAVGQTVDRLHGEMASLHDKVAADLQQFASLKNAGAQNVTTYEEAKSHIVIRLQVGTTRGNPDLVSEWNAGQSALDALTGNINSLATLGTEISTDAGRAHTGRNTIADTFNMAGANDEDHRQLNVLQTEADQLVGALDQMQRSLSQTVQRQTAFVANERGNLTTLASAIKNGELYPTTDMPATASLAPSAATASSPGSAIVTIRFDRKKTDFEQELYAALNKALQSKPGATFRVVAVSPTGGSAAAMQTAQSDAHRHAQEVLKSMTDMGVPAARVSVSSSTDPSVSTGEVRVFAK